ncbi:sigma-E factor regulatory protein RseB domain-containing protein [Pseudomonas denitrificans (nom. rej.)]|uniref:sigma-E factor regulatory protein RseB domain-containing protein n=1 Tax=Pseudomonas denitrificans TaxID=43306 RepID=UPI002570003B|nr:sigma-E factor regulatory protein RseB domain-containing protein [Pseudomonas denitrificans (nom. rej.)]
MFFPRRSAGIASPGRRCVGLDQALSADQQQNFQGTFIYERSGAFSPTMSGIVWRVTALCREHLVQVDGPRQEVVRVDGATQCVGGGMSGQASTGEMWPARKLNPADLSTYYDVRVAGEFRIAIVRRWCWR